MKSPAPHFYSIVFCLIAFGALSGCGSPQTAPMTTKSTLTGDCFGQLQDYGPQCGLVQDLTDCPAGQAAIKPTSVSCPLPPGTPRLVDASRTC